MVSAYDIDPVDGTIQNVVYTTSFANTGEPITSWSDTHFNDLGREYKISPLLTFVTAAEPAGEVLRAVVLTNAATHAGTVLAVSDLAEQVPMRQQLQAMHVVMEIGFHRGRLYVASRQVRSGFDPM